MASLRMPTTSGSLPQSGWSEKLSRKRDDMSSSDRSVTTHDAWVARVTREEAWSWPERQRTVSLGLETWHADMQVVD